MSTWLYLEPYVYVSIKGKDVLFYNTLDGQALEFWNQPEIVRLAKRLLHYRNLYIVEMSPTDLQNAEWSQCLSKLREHFFGDLYEGAENSEKPVPLLPLYRIMRDISYLKKEWGRSVGENVLGYLQEIRIYLNESCAQTCSFCSYAYRQFSYCQGKSDPQSRNISFQDLRRFLDQIHLLHPVKLQFSGGDLFLYPHLRELVTGLPADRFTPECLVSFRHAIGRLGEMETLGAWVRNWRIGMDFPVSSQSVSEFMASARERGIPVSWEWIVQSESDFHAAQTLIEAMDLNDSRFHPLYNGENREFFEQFVFLSRDQVLSSETSPRELFGKSRINSINFGHLIIRPDGQVYANLNQPPLGRINKHSLAQILFRELNHGRSWLRVRNQVQPCRTCVYEALCPPLSNYEYALNQNDMCHIPAVLIK